MGVRVSNQRTIAWWLVDRILHLLDEEERDAVRGDLAESCDSAAQALRSVLRLVMHRQSMLWQHPRPWLVLFLFVMPLGVLLSFTSRSHAGLSAIYLWLVVNNANFSLLRSAGFWYTLLQILPALLLPSLYLGCVAWMAGALLAGIARRTLWISGALLCLMLLCANALSLPQPQQVLAFDNTQRSTPMPSTETCFRYSFSASAFCSPHSWACGRGSNQASSHRHFEGCSGPPSSSAHFRCWPVSLHFGCCASGFCRHSSSPYLHASARQPIC
jgi:hypothetical protein